MIVRNLLARGNAKLGESIHSWSIPPVDTCPGRSALCERVCYARSGHFYFPAVLDRMRENLDVALAEDFVSRMTAEIRRRRVQVLRVHVSGDFFSPEYAAKWHAIAAHRNRTVFYAYTRSWRVEEIAPSLADLAGLENVRLWYSADRETGAPPELPPRAEVAWLQTEPGEAIKRAGVVFRVRRLRDEPARRIGLTVVCPNEADLPKAKEITCTSCGRCFE